MTLLARHLGTNVVCEWPLIAYGWHYFRNLDEASNVMADKKEASKEEEIQRRSNIYISYLNDPTEAGMKRLLTGF